MGKDDTREEEEQIEKVVEEIVVELARSMFLPPVRESYEKAVSYQLLNLDTMPVDRSVIGFFASEIYGQDEGLRNGSIIGFACALAMCKKYGLDKVIGALYQDKEK